MTTPAPSPDTPPGSVDFSDLAPGVRGRLLLPGDSGYDDARAVWNGRIDRRPAAILRCAGAADVMAGVRFARESGLALSVRGSGHHTAGHAVADGGLMLDLSPMNGVRVDPERRRVRVGPGATVRDVDHETQAFGLVTTGAPVSMVGMAGYTLGGGLGWTSRAHGLACDNLVAADVITAAGERVRASADENPELFWGLRGGSGNFGVVTSFEYRLHELGPRVLAGPVVHAMDAAPALLRFWRDYMADAPDALQCMPVIFALPPEPGSGESQGETVFALFPLWAGDPGEGEAVVRPLREAGSPLSDDVGLVPYAGLLASLDEMYRAGHRVYYRSAFFDTLPDAAIDAFVEGAAPVPTPFSSLFLEPLGGAIARVPSDATAFPHRERAFCVTAVPKWERPERDDEMTGWADRLFDALAPFAAPGVYVNYLDDVAGAGGDPWVGHRDRLRALKRAWDPDNLFRMNENIRPD
ncbi:MAG: FAD-binding oxidoreductase [Candidatus Longimicrobiales bacterium M2_2A_002]